MSFKDAAPKYITRLKEEGGKGIDRKSANSACIDSLFRSEAAGEDRHVRRAPVSEAPPRSRCLRSDLQSRVGRPEPSVQHGRGVGLAAPPTGQDRRSKRTRAALFI